MLSHGRRRTGRILLLEFDGSNRQRVRKGGERTMLGLWNLNFYVDDIRATTRALTARGYRFWSEPVGYDISRRVGRPVEVVFDGPDGLAINLVELSGGSPHSVIGRIRRYYERHGRTRTGFSPVTTTSHAVRSHARALAFYREVLGMNVLIDEVLARPETNRFLGRPKNGRTRSTFLQGGHPFGKVALSYPLNYELPDRVALAVAPNIGYLAQGFLVESLAEATKACARVDARIVTPAVTVSLPGLGGHRAMLVRNPGSGALMELIEKH